MTRRAALAVTAAAWAAYLASWFLPVVRFAPGGLVRDIDAGWKAFLMTLSMAQKPDRLDWSWGLCIAGVLANVAVVASPWVLRQHSRPVWFLTVLAAAFILNLAWIPMMSDSVLLPGYWLWIGSVGMIAMAALMKRRP